MKLLYLQHVDWAWLPQRPHFLAVALAHRSHEIRVRYIRAHRRKGLVRSNLPTNQLQAVEAVAGAPKWDRPLARSTDRELLRRAIRRSLARETCDAIWITHPRWWPAVSGITSLPIVYDRMDDPVAMSDYPRYVQSLETELISRADLILASSPALRTSSGRDDAVEIRNAARADAEWPAFGNVRGTHGDARRPDERCRVLFFGTIGPWLDFDVLEELCSSPRVDLRLIGPVRSPVPAQLRQSLRPAMSHPDLIREASRWADCLLLPFRIDAFAETVDPVKLYEYIALWKPIVAPPLKVLSFASPFIETYRGRLEVLPAIEQARTNPVEEHRDFVLENTWDARAATVDAHLAQLR